MTTEQLRARFQLTISIHIPRVGDDLLFRFSPYATPGRISIHIPRVGDDPRTAAQAPKPKRFQSTSPAWGMTGFLFALAAADAISIHIPRVGDDRGFARENARGKHDFNPHPPRGG